MTDPTPSKLAEAKKLMEGRRNGLLRAAADSGSNPPLLFQKGVDNGGYIPLDAAEQFVEKLIEASALIAASEQREKAAKIIENFWYDEYQNEEDKKNYLKYKILNQDSQQNISSKKSNSHD